MQRGGYNSFTLYWVRGVFWLALPVLGCDKNSKSSLKSCFCATLKKGGAML